MFLLKSKIQTSRQNIRDTAKKFENKIVYRVSVGITVDAPVTAVSNKTNDIQCFKDI